MKTRGVSGKFFIIALFTCLTAGCAGLNGVTVNNSDKLALVVGESDMLVGKVSQAELKIPTSNRVATGAILTFSPVEFRAEKERFSVDALHLPLGRYVVLRQSGEGVTAGLKPAEAKTFDIYYDARYETVAAARKDFPKIADNKIKSKMVDGKSVIEVEQWRMRLTMLPSRDQQAFRVLLDQIEYNSPQPAEAAEDTPTTNHLQVPVIVAFSYRHPDVSAENFVQQNVFFEFSLDTATGSFIGKPQLSGWVPLHHKPDTTPYTVGVVVAEVNAADEAGYRQLVDFVKSVRGLI